MMPQRVGSDACRLSLRWGLSLRLSEALTRMEVWATQRFAIPGFSFWPGLRIVSGQRSPEKNRAVGGASDSRHMDCPATAADLRVGTVTGVDSVEVWQILGGWWKVNGHGRWGGDFTPIDQNHFDLG